MSSDLRTAHDIETAAAGGAVAPAGRRAPSGPLAEDSRLAVEIRGLVDAGNMDEARERYGDLVTMHQRRATRIAYQYLRDAAEADEAVQDAFVKVFSHITSYREAWPFEVWFTRILINGCLDRRKARTRRDRIAAAIDRLDGRQRTVFMLCHYGDCTPREVSVMTGLNESTVRVHLFRAARKLRGRLGGKP